MYELHYPDGRTTVTDYVSTVILAVHAFGAVVVVRDPA